MFTGSESNLLPRPRLIRRIQRALQTGPIFIAAPPGYGKSILLRDYAIYRPGATIITLRQTDLELAGLQQKISQVPPDQPLLLDDVHLLDGAVDIQEWLHNQLCHSTRSWIVAGRAIAPLLLSDAPAQSLLTEKHLALTRSEMHHLLQNHFSQATTFSDQEWDMLYHRTAGWPLAVSLLAYQPHAALNLAQSLPANRQQPIQAISHLVTTILQDLPQVLRDFLLVTALPERFNRHLSSELLNLSRQTAQEYEADIIRRNLFISADDLPGWYRYHDLFRECLVQEASRIWSNEKIATLRRRIAAWFYSTGDVAAAIDHALLAQDSRLAARYLAAIPPEHIWDQGIFRTYQRWVSSLDDCTQTHHPEYLVTLGRSRMYIGDRKGAQYWFRRAADFAAKTGNQEATWQAQVALARLFTVEGAPDAALQLCAQVIKTAPPTANEHVHALNAAGNVLVELNRFPAAQRHYARAVALLPHLTDEPATIQRIQATLYHNLAILSTHLGHLQKALEYLQENDRYYADRPVARSLHLLAWCGFHEAIGDWPALAHDLAEIERAEALSEHPDDENTWYFWNLALYHIGRSEAAKADSALDTMHAMATTDEEQLCYAYAKAWQARRLGHKHEARKIVQNALDQPWQGEQYRGILALEWLLSEWLPSAAETQDKIQRVNEDSVEPLQLAANSFLRTRAHLWLFRLRACLACHTHAVQNPRWQRHLASVLRKTEQKFYSDLLINREPELGLAFWMLCLTTGHAPVRAADALIQLATAQNGLAPATVAHTLLNALEHPFAFVRTHAARLLAQLNWEAAIPYLAGRLNLEPDAEAQQALHTALRTLESSPPPPLRITLLGAFGVVRGEQQLKDEDWQRPAVRRLFQYFALHRGQRLSRDQILDDLWPDSQPAAARNTFRTVFSWLRRVLDPHLRPKSPARYFNVEEDMYCFAPDSIPTLVCSDVEIFEQNISAALARSEPDDLPLLPPEFLQSLETWAPLLPDLPYASWTVAARERIDNLYVEGCLYAAQTFLHLAHPAEAAHWSRKSIDTAPWLEEAYQILMQAQARQGHRALALRTYAEVVTALHRELDVPPSALTEWLALRLRQSETI